MSYQHVKTWRIKARERLFNAFNRQCTMCGYNKHPRIMDFHHLEPISKGFDIGSFKVVKWDRIVVESRKCVMLCKRCHVEVTLGLEKIPDNAFRFNEDYADWPKSERPMDSCPVCLKKKSIRKKYCSPKCANTGAFKVNWNEIDLKKLMEEKSIAEIARDLEVSWNAVGKRARKLGLR